jgi:hypothetical protein
MLKDTLKEDMKNALKAGDSARRTLIGMVLTSMRNKEIEKRTVLAKTITDAAQLDAQSQLNDEEAMAVIATEVKRRKDSIAEFEKGGRPELAASEQSEIDILKTYLPEQMSDEALRALVQKTIAATGASSAKDIGKVMSAVMAEVKGTAEGQRVSAMAKEELSK